MKPISGRKNIAQPGADRICDLVPGDAEHPFVSFLREEVNPLCNRISRMNTHVLTGAGNIFYGFSTNLLSRQKRNAFAEGRQFPPPQAIEIIKSVLRTLKSPTFRERIKLTTRDQELLAVDIEPIMAKLDSLYADYARHHEQQASADSIRSKAAEVLRRESHLFSADAITLEGCIRQMCTLRTAEFKGVAFYPNTQGYRITVHNKPVSGRAKMGMCKLSEIIFGRPDRVKEKLTANKLTEEDCQLILDTLQANPDERKLIMKKFHAAQRDGMGR